MTEEITEEQTQKHQKWNDLVDALAKHLCEAKGDNMEYWKVYIGIAERYLETRTLNKYFWENLCGCMDNEA